jgi:hypothetical protein
MPHARTWRRSARYRWFTDRPVVVRGETMGAHPSAPLAPTGGVILEVNGLPGIHYHYLVDPAMNHRSVAVPILEALLDPVKGVATDTGSDGVGWEVRSGRSRVAPVHHSGV